MKSPMLESVFNKAAGLHLANLLKERLQLKSFLVNTAKIFKSIFFYRTPPTTASSFNLKVNFFGRYSSGILTLGLGRLRYFKNI